MAQGGRPPWMRTRRSAPWIGIPTMASPQAHEVHDKEGDVLHAAIGVRLRNKL